MTWKYIEENEGALTVVLDLQENIEHKVEGEVLLSAIIQVQIPGGGREKNKEKKIKQKYSTEKWE